MPLNRPYRTRCRYDYPSNGLTSRHGTDSQAHSSIGTPPPHHREHAAAQALTARRRPVSGTLSLPSRGTFHHSLTVLIRYRSPGRIQAAKWSWQTHTGFHEPRATTGTRPHATSQVPPTGLSPATARRPRRFSYPASTTPPTTAAAGNRHAPTTPPPQPPPGLARQRFSHHPLSLATTHGISSPTGTEMFHFPASPPAPYTIQARVTPHNECRVPPFGHPRITARQPAPRGISQATTSFIGP